METIQDFIAMFNGATSRNFKPVDSYERAFKARLKEGFTFEEMTKAVNNAALHGFLRGDNPSKKDYLTPEYILRPNKLQEWAQATVLPLVGSPEYYE